MPETIEAMEELAGETETQEIEEKSNEEHPPAVEPEKPEEEKPPAEPEKKEVETPAELEGVLPDEDLKAIFSSFDEDVIEEKPAYQPPAQQQQGYQPPPQQQQQVPAIPQEVLNITPQQFMPEGQEFDPTDVYTPGSASNQAALRVQAEQNRHFYASQRERENQEQVARQGVEAIDRVNARMEREKWPKALREKFWNKSPTSPDVLDVLADGFLLGEHRAVRKARKKTQSPGGNGESPAPVNKASRVTEAPKSQGEIDKEVDETFGPKQSSGI